VSDECASRCELQSCERENIVVSPLAAKNIFELEGDSSSSSKFAMWHSPRLTVTERATCIACSMRCLCWRRVARRWASNHLVEDPLHLIE
jgi:hypothetical protein